MAGCNRKDWDELNITKEEVENLKEALKKEEFRKLLSEYADEVTDPKNREQYQKEIIQLEAERGVDCTFVNPEPGFVVKTSVDGKKKAFINICQNKVIGKPTCKTERKNDSNGLSWSIPFSQAPGREDHDKKHSRCVVYDVVFHPVTLQLAEKNSQFKKLVVDTALSAVESNYKVNLDKKNVKYPKMKFKGVPFATVIRKKSEKQPVLTEEELEFQKNMNYPAPPPVETKKGETIMNMNDIKKDEGKYTVPRYIVRHRTGIDLQEFTYDKNAKINIAIPKELVIEVNLPLLNSSKDVALDVMENSIHLVCEKPVKYKLDIELPYAVREEEGNAKFDKDERILIIILPVVRAKTTVAELLREDSGVESDFGDRIANSDDASPVGSITNMDHNNGDKIESENICDINCVETQQQTCISDKEVKETNETEQKISSFLDVDKEYIMPPYKCNFEENNLCFIVNVKNIDPNSVEKQMLGTNGCHLKFLSLGSGFFPVFYAFLVKFIEEQCHINSVKTDVWDNNLTMQISLEKCGSVSSYYVGIDENSLAKMDLENTGLLEEKLNKMKLMAKQELDEDDDTDTNVDNKSKVSVSVESANAEEMIIKVIPELPKANPVVEKVKGVLTKSSKKSSKKSRTFSESSADDILVSPVATKSILKHTVFGSYPDTNAEDYGLGSSIEASEGSEICLHEEPAGTKKTVRFNNHIGRHVFRMNSSILSQKKKSQKRSRNRRKGSDRRISESENSEGEIKENDINVKNRDQTLVQELQTNENNITCDSNKAVISDSKENATGDFQKEIRFMAKKDDKIFEFKSDLIFDLDM